MLRKKTGCFTNGFTVFDSDTDLEADEQNETKGQTQAPYASVMTMK